MRSIACNIYKLKYQHINREECLLSNLVLTIIRSAHLVFVCHGINYQVPPGVPPNASVARIMNLQFKKSPQLVKWSGKLQGTLDACSGTTSICLIWIAIGRVMSTNQSTIYSKLQCPSLQFILRLESRENLRG